MSNTQTDQADNSSKAPTTTKQSINRMLTHDSIRNDVKDIDGIKHTIGTADHDGTIIVFDPKETSRSALARQGLPVTQIEGPHEGSTDLSVGLLPAEVQTTLVNLKESPIGGKAETPRPNTRQIKDTQDALDQTSGVFYTEKQHVTAKHVNIAFNTNEIDREELETVGYKFADEWNRDQFTRNVKSHLVLAHNEPIPEGIAMARVVNYRQ